MVKTIKLKDEAYKIKLPKKSAFTIETPENQVKLHQLNAVCSVRGYGKGVILSSLLQGFKHQGCLDRCFIISPTIESNRPIFGPLEINPEDEYSTGDPANILDIIKKVEEEQEEWDQYQEAFALWRIINDHSININSIDPKILLKALENGYFNKKPEPKYRNSQGGRPCLALIVDDCQGDKIYNATGSKNPFINLCLRHRHIGKGLGLSIFMCCQTYGGSGGIPRIIRQNITSLLLGEQKNKEVLDQIADEIGGQIEKEKFFEVYERAVFNEKPNEQNHNFLLLDFFPKRPDMMFRRNLDTFIIPSDLKSKV